MGWPSWELSDSPEIWSAFADGVTAIAAAAGLGYLLADRHWPRGYLFAAWGRSDVCAEPGATQVELYAATLMAEPARLMAIKPEPGWEIALRPAKYSLATAKRQAQPEAGDAQAQLNWLPNVTFTKRPRMVGGPIPGGDYRPVARVFVRGGRHGSEGRLKLAFERTTKPGSRIVRTVTFTVRLKSMEEAQGHSSASSSGSAAARTI